MREKWRIVSLNNKLVVVFAGITTFATVVYSVFAGWQLSEIHSGAADTHTLAVAAKTQAEKAESISTSIGQAVGQLTLSANAASQQAQAAQDSIGAIQGQTFQAERPWVAVDVAVKHPDSFSFDSTNGAILSLIITLRNTGLSVANHVKVTSVLVPSMDWTPVLKRMCPNGNPWDNDKTVGAGWVMFPTQQVIDNMGVASATPQEIAKASEKYPIQTMPPGSVGFNLIVCADYTSVLDSRHHYTRRVYMVGWTNPGNGAAMGAFQPKMPYSGIGLVPMMAGDSAD